MSSDAYQLYAIRYGHHPRKAAENFIGGDDHVTDMPLDYFVWAIVGAGRTFVLDTGFDPEVARRRGRITTRPIEQGLKAIGVEPGSVQDVIVSHMHYDHAGNLGAFPNARFHIQDAEMAYCTGRCMCHGIMRMPFEAQDVASMVHKVFEGRVQFHEGTAELAPGITLHKLGGHTKGLQVVRVKTERGWVVLASDAAHLYANLDRNHPFPVLADVGDYLEGLNTVRKLASSLDHIIPGHDPQVLTDYPAVQPGLEGVVRVDLEPKRTRV
jgi:glyoxylase-like metal-dependent hydrolase (beta-lactamase superfamily II)